MTRPEPGEWQRDERGRLYRKFGNTIEYEMDLNGLPESVFRASQKAQEEKRKQEAAQEEERKRRAREAEAQRRNCPFNGGTRSDCRRDACALYVDGCTLARLASKPVKNTTGLTCPFNKYHYACRIDCALFKDGCTLTGI